MKDYFDYLTEVELDELPWFEHFPNDLPLACAFATHTLLGQTM